MNSDVPQDYRVLDAATRRDVGDPNQALMFRDIAVGAVVTLRDGSTARVVANPGDGAWLFLEVIESPADPARVGVSDMVFCTDIVGLAS